MIKSFFLVLVIFIYYNSSFVTNATKPIEIKNQIDDLLSEKKYNEIINLYLAESEKFDENNKIVVAYSYRMVDDFESSIKVLESLKLQQTDLYLRQKFELATACFMAKDYDCVIENIDLFIEKTDQSNIEMRNNLKVYTDSFKKKALFEKQKEGQIFHGSIGVAYAYDSNPNFINTKSSYVSQTQFYSNNNHHDFATISTGSLNYNYKFNRNLFIFGGVYGNYRRYNEIKTRDSLLFNGSQGIGYRYNKFTLGTQFSYSSSFYGNSNVSKIGSGDISISLYSGSFFLGYAFNRYISLKSIYQLTYTDINVGMKRSAILNSIAQQVQINLPTKTFIFLNGMVGIEKSNISAYTHIVYNASAILRQHLTIPFYIEFAYNYTKLDFKNLDPFLMKIRNDSFHDITTSIHYILFNHIDIYASYSYSKNISNVDLFKFNRHMVLSGIRAVF